MFQIQPLCDKCVYITKDFPQFVVGRFYFLSGIIRRAEVFNLNAGLFFYVFLQSLVFMLCPLLIKDQKDVFL